MLKRIADWRMLVIVIIVILMIYRAPYLFMNPRFWAEEGVYYFTTSFHNSWYRAIISSHQGYYSLFPNFMTLIAAKWVCLEYAPLITTIGAFLAQLLSYIVVLYRLDDDILRPAQKILLCIVIMFVAHTGEIWLNTITTQFHFAVVSFFILLANHKQISRGWIIFDRIFLLTAGLTGTISCFLLPVFIIRWLYDKGKDVLMLIIILCFTSIVQFLYIFTSHHLGARLSYPGLNPLLTTWMHQFLIWPIFGWRSGQVFNKHSINLIAFIILVVIFAITARSKYYRRRSVLTIISFFLVSMLSLLGSIRMSGGWRYAYAPAVILLSLFVMNIYDKSKIVSFVSLLMVLLSVILWVPYYRASLKPWVVPNGPVWVEEVQIWRKDPSYPLKIYPQWEGAKWSLILQKE